MINVPLSDDVYLRAQAASLNQDGYVERGPQELGGSEDTIARLQLGWHPSDDVQRHVRRDCTRTPSPTAARPI